MTKTTKLLIEQHIHGAYGIDFNKANNEGIIYLSEKLFNHGIGGYFPTLVTDSVKNIKQQIKEIKKAAEIINSKFPARISKILGVHLEGVFINPEKKGIHDPKYFLASSIENFRLIEDDFIKIVTLAPELDEGLMCHLSNKGIKVQAGHCIASDLWGVNGVTHLFNAMSGISHRAESTVLSALLNKDVYTEIICDGVHLSDRIIELTVKMKPADKIILISDALPITYSDIKETEFAGQTIYYNGKSATSITGTIAGSTTLLDKIIKRLYNIGLLNLEYINNPYKYHNIDLDGEIIWDTNFDILEVRSRK